jgi:hypothetical protein
MYHQLSGVTPKFLHKDPQCLRTAFNKEEADLRLIVVGSHLMHCEELRWLSEGKIAMEDTAMAEIIILKSYFPKIDSLTLNRNAQVYEFFKANGEEYQNFYDKLDNGDLMRSLGDIVYEVYAQITSDFTTGVNPAGDKPKVFLTESPDLQLEKNNLKRELEYLGYEVVSPVLKLADKEKLEEMCSDHSVFIHLIGGKLSMEEKSNRSREEWLMDMQLKQLKSLRNNGGESAVGVYTWISPAIANKKRGLWNGHHGVMSKIESDNDIEMLNGSFEDFKNFLGMKLSVKPAAKKAVTAGDGDEPYAPAIYFIHDQRDKKEADTYIDYLRKIGYTVYNPIFDQDILTARQLHDECLKRFDVVVIFALQVSLQWINMKMVDILKSQGMGRKKPIKGKFLISNKTLELKALSHARQFEFMAHEEMENNLSNLAVFLNLSQQEEEV